MRLRSTCGARTEEADASPRIYVPGWPSTVRKYCAISSLTRQAPASIVRLPRAISVLSLSVTAVIIAQCLLNQSSHVRHRRPPVAGALLLLHGNAVPALILRIGHSNATMSHYTGNTNPVRLCQIAQETTWPNLSKHHRQH